MSNVTLTIGGRSFTVACAEGEESHVTSLGHTINTKLSSMGDMSGQSEPRMLLFAALLLADEVHELKSHTPSASPPSAPDGTVRRLDAIAARLENLAAALEG
ncbi:MAG TPA: cell division protein ZapA [Novosphingobium sp.]